VSGIFDQLPDLASVEDLRDLVGTDFQKALDRTPRTPTDILGSLPDALNALSNAVPGDPGALVQPLSTLFDKARNAADLDLAQPVQDVAGGLTQVRSDVLGSALGELVFAPGETRDLREILLEQVPALTDQFLSGLTSMRDGVISAERVQETIDFVGEISALTANLPTEPDGIVDFLAQSFVGLPGSLLDAPLAVSGPVLDRLEQMADAAANSGVQLHLMILMAQLDGVASRIGSIDLSAESSYQAVIDGLTAAQTSLTAISDGVQGAIDGVGDGLSLLDLGQFETGFQSAIEGIPALEVTSLEEVGAGILAPLERINQAMEELDPLDFVDRLKALLQGIAEGQQELALGSWQADVLGFFEEVKAFIEQLDLTGIRDQIVSAFDTIEEEISSLGQDFKQTILDAINEPLDAVEDAVDSIDLASVTAFIEDVFGRLNTALDNISVADLQAELLTAFGTLDGVVGELVTQTTSIAGQLDDIISNLGEIQFDPVTSEVIAEIEDLTGKLGQIDPDSLGTPQKIALSAAVGILQAIDFQGTVTDFLTERCNEIVALPQEPLQTVADRLDTFFAMVVAFDPEIVVAPLGDLYDQILEPIQSLEAGALIQPLDDLLARAKEAFDALSPARLKEPLDDLYTPLPAALDALSPAELLRPVVDVFDGFEEALRKVDLTALFEELELLLDDLFAQAKAEIVDHIQGLGLPAPVSDFLTSLTALLDLASPAFFTDPANKLVGVMDSVLEDFNPGDLFVPLQTLYDELVALLDLVEDGVLVDGFERVRETLSTTLSRTDPAVVVGRINNLSLETSTFYAALNPASLTTALDGPYQSLTDAFAGLDESEVPAEHQGLYDQIEALVADVDSQPALGGLQSSYTTTLDQLDDLGQVSLDGLGATFAPVRQQIDALIPDFLREPVTAESIATALDDLRPDALAAQVDAAFDEFRERFTALRPRLVAELQEFADEQQDMLLFFDFGALADRFQEIYDAIIEQVTALNPSIIVDELQGVFETVKAEIEDLNPTFLVDELTETFDGIKDKLDDLGLGAVEAGLDATLQNVKDKLALLDPVEILRQAGLLDTFADLQDALAEISVADLVADLDEALKKLCAELESELEKTQAAFERMLAAVPSVGAGVGF
jgi:hypothetical protein